MAGHIHLGLVPQQLTVTLVSGADFVAALVSDSAWPVGVGIELHLLGGASGSVVWPAIITGVRADWDVPAEDVQTALSGQPGTAHLVYAEADGTVLLWAKGRINVY